jgi:hypothetical protein
MKFTCAPARKAMALDARGGQPRSSSHSNVAIWHNAATPPVHAKLSMRMHQDRSHPALRSGAV